MNKTYVSIIVLVLVALGLFFVLKNKKSEAPTVDQNMGYNTQMNANGETTTPPPATDLNVNADVTTPPVTTSGAVKEFTVTGQNFSFSPNTITVNKGDKVKITFTNTQGMHNFIIDEFGVASKTSKSPDTEVLEFTASKTGSFQYYCSVGSHRAMGMFGTLTVK